MLSLFILVPLFILLVINLPSKALMQRLIFWVGCLFCLFQIASVIFMQQSFWQTNILVLSRYLRFDLAMDNLSRLMLLCIGLTVLVSFMVGRYLISEPHQRFNFSNLLFAILIGMNGVVLSKDIFSLYVFLEVTAVTSFILIVLYKRRDSLEAAFKYIILSSVATVLMLASIAMIVLVVGSTSFEAIKSALLGMGHSRLITVAIGVFLCGLFIKGGLVPFHGWLADAYASAPAPVSILLAGIVTKTVGVYIIMRLALSVFVLDKQIGAVLMFIGTLSILVGAFEALGQNDFKRMLAYSSISQVGYIVLGLGCATPLGVAAAAFHLFNHSVFKSLLFVNAASVEHSTGTHNMDKVGGLASKMPFTGLTSIIGSLSVAGVPPLSGFWSKLIIIIALFSSGHVIYASIAIMASVLTLGYMLSMQRRMFFGNLLQGLENIKESGLGLAIPAALLAVIVAGVGVFFPYVLNTFILPVGNILK